MTTAAKLGRLELVRRGWTAAMVGKFLPAPDSGGKWPPELIAVIESSAAWQAEFSKAVARREKRAQAQRAMVRRALGEKPEAA